MILPTQQAYGQAATNLMQSMLEQMEDRRKEEAEKASPKPKVDPVIEAKIAASEEHKRARDKIAEALFGQGQVDINEMRMDLIEKLGEKLGIDVEEAKSSFGLGSAFQEAIKSLDYATQKQLSEDIGLDDLNITLEQFVLSVKNPYGDENDRLKEALESQAGKSGLADSRKVLQRLDDVADPKTLTELKMGPQYSDPTRVEDDETRAERRQDIASAEASQKLEDVEKAQDAVEKHNELAATLPEGAAEAVQALDPLNLLQIAAAAAENIELVADDPAATEETDVAGGEDAEAAADAVGEADSEAAAEIMAKQVEELQDQQAEDVGQSEILPIEVDEIGLYALLKKALPLAA